MTLTLPNALRRGELRSFCLAVSVTTLMTLALLVGFSWMFVYAAAPILCICLIGLLLPGLVRIPYRIWNKSSKLYARFASVYIMTIAFHLIVRLVGLTVLSKRCSEPSPLSSSWVSRGPNPVPAYTSQYETSDDFSVHAPWPAGFLAWAWRTGNIASMFLLPFLMIVSVLQSEEEAPRVADIYTLF